MDVVLNQKEKKTIVSIMNNDWFALYMHDGLWWYLWVCYVYATWLGEDKEKKHCTDRIDLVGRSEFLWNLQKFKFKNLSIPIKCTCCILFYFWQPSLPSHHDLETQSIPTKRESLWRTRCMHWPTDKSLVDAKNGANLFRWFWLPKSVTNSRDRFCTFTIVYVYRLLICTC